MRRIFRRALWIITCRNDLDASRDPPQLIRDFNAAKGGANTDTEGYHGDHHPGSIRAARVSHRPSG